MVIKFIAKLDDRYAEFRRDLETKIADGDCEYPPDVDDVYMRLLRRAEMAAKGKSASKVFPTNLPVLTERRVTGRPQKQSSKSSAADGAGPVHKHQNPPPAPAPSRAATAQAAPAVVSSTKSAMSDAVDSEPVCFNCGGVGHKWSCLLYTSPSPRDS